MKFDKQNRRSGFVFCCLKPRVKRGVPYSFSDESLWNCKYHIVLAPKYRRHGKIHEVSNYTPQKIE
jgi:hypothetical protein